MIGLIAVLLWVVFLFWIAPIVSDLLIAKYEPPVKVLPPERSGELNRLEITREPRILTFWNAVEQALFYLLLIGAAVLGFVSLFLKGLTNKILGLITLLIAVGVLLYFFPPLPFF